MHAAPVCPLVEVPASQGVHVVRFPADVDSPAIQLLQLPVPADSVYFPGEHGEQDVCPVLPSVD